MYFRNEWKSLRLEHIVRFTQKKRHKNSEGALLSLTKSWKRNEWMNDRNENRYKNSLWLSDFILFPGKEE